MGIRKKIMGLVLCLLLVMGMAAAAFADSTVMASWDNLSLSSDGTATWSLTINMSGDNLVQQYELTLARMNNGTWNESYKTYKFSTDDSERTISFSTTGQYKFKIRAKIYGGLYTAWSDFSNTVIVTSDDIGGSSGSATYYAGYGPGNPPPVTYTGIGPGNPTGTTITTTTTTTTTNSTTGPVTSGNTGSGWVQQGTKWKYRYSNNTYAANTWECIDSKWYYFGSDGIMQTDWIYYNNAWYLCLPSGERATGWRNYNEKWYYLNDSGVMQTGYITVDGKVYYCDSTGARVANNATPDGHYFDNNGVMVY